ncbi:unnamed protein product [Darwinula stevensoni]|uniref:Fibronectin type-III domain-containing protein n=1 Tax=Darwinula stevensoni TaxID=69355 RepID=A0A7R9A405_9CRUS|nr:unnamed protein product [Darwinula stevensoni]CAG0882414.1 unnamed protein product [Darwinula stevensoni]
MSDIVEIASLGRPFRLGCLYDRRNEKVVTGVTLWNEKTLQENLVVQKSESYSTEITVEDSFKEKTSALNIDGNLKLSLLVEVVELSGSCLYLQDRKSSKREASVNLRFKSTSKFETLATKLLRNIKYPEMIHQDVATHVVTGIQYGADAFFLFREKVSSSEDAKKWEVKLKAELHKVFSCLPPTGLAAGGEKSKEKEGARMTCRYHGDITLQKTPTSVEEAIECYQSFMTLSREGCVPKRIHLFPLQKLVERPAGMVREISMGVVNDVETFLEGLHEIKMKANDLAESSVCDRFRGIKAQLNTFRSHLERFKSDLQEKLVPLLKSARASGEEEIILSGLVREKRSSPYNLEKLTDWLENKESGIKTLENCLKQLTGIKMSFSPHGFDSVLLDLDAQHVLCFRFKVIPRTDSYLRLMSRYLNEEEIETSPDEIPSSWHENRKCWQNLRVGLEYFRDVFRAYKRGGSRERGFHFVMTQDGGGDVLSHDESDGDSPYEIVYYHNGKERPNLPPWKPGTPKAQTVTGDSISVTWDPPAFGAESVRGYLVSYKSDVDERWDEHEVRGHTTEATLDHLSSSTNYVFKGVASWFMDETGWRGIGVLYLNPPKYSFFRAINDVFQDISDGEEVNMGYGTWGGIENRVFLFQGKKTFVVPVARKSSWIPPSDQSVRSLPSLTSPFYVFKATCLVPCPVPENRFYLFGGMSEDEKRSLSDAGVFIPSEGGGTWLPLPPLPRKIAGAAGTSLKDGSVITVGGLDFETNEMLRTVYLFDHREDGRYQPLQDIPEPISRAAATVWRDTHVVLTGGVTGNGVDSSQVRLFDLRAGKWEVSSTWPCLQSTRIFHGLGKDTRDRVVALGGLRFGPLHTMEVLETNGVEQEGGHTWKWDEYPLPHSIKSCLFPRVLL